jgi:hypothetical protein
LSPGTKYIAKLTKWFTRQAAQAPNTVPLQSEASVQLFACRDSASAAAPSLAFSSQRFDDGSLQPKMVGAPVFPRIEKRDQTSRAREQRPNIGTLPQIATEATISEVILGRRTAMLPAYYVIYLMGRIRIVLVQQTVFATELCAFAYERS